MALPNPVKTDFSNVDNLTPTQVNDIAANLLDLDARVNHEIVSALESAYLLYNSVNTVDIVFPRVFSDGSTWATIVGVSTSVAGKTNGNIYWLGIYYDATKSYTPTSGPLTADIAIAWSGSNSTEPARPANGKKIGTLLRGVGTAGGDCDISEFYQSTARRTNYKSTRPSVTVSTNQVSRTETTTVQNAIPPTATVLFGYVEFYLTSATARYALLQFLSGTATVIQELQIHASPSPTNNKLGLTGNIEYPLLVVQTVYTAGLGNTGANVDLTSAIFRVSGYIER